MYFEAYAVTGTTGILLVMVARIKRIVQLGEGIKILGNAMNSTLQWHGSTRPLMCPAMDVQSRQNRWVARQKIFLIVGNGGTLASPPLPSPKRYCPLRLGVRLSSDFAHLLSAAQPRIADYRSAAPNLYASQSSPRQLGR